MLEKLSTNSHQSNSLPSPICKIWKQALDGVPHFAKRLHSSVCRDTWFISFKSLLRTLAKVLAKVKLLMHYEYRQWWLQFFSLFLCALLPIEMRLSSLVALKGEDHIFFFYSASLSNWRVPLPCTSETSVLWQHRNCYSCNSSTKDWSREQMVFGGHGLFCPHLFERGKKKKWGKKKE